MKTKLIAAAAILCLLGAVAAIPQQFTVTNTLVPAKNIYRDSLVTVFSWTWDDALDTLLTGGYVDSFQTHNQPFSVSIIAWKPLHGDTTNNEDGLSNEYLSVSDLQNMEKRTITDEQGNTRFLVSWNGHGYGADDLNIGGGFTVSGQDLWRADTVTTDSRRMRDGKFTNASTASKFLVKGKDAYVGDHALHHTNTWASWGRLDELIKEGKTLIPYETGYVDADTYWNDYMIGQHNRATSGQAP
ncbi:MAG: hypothetical protein IH969_10200, partial [Candidatus Krumholzibacteriota bacterium]|nr:hypothetical protein [Candidatus Krumholzibacteriota bacterium]